MGGVADGGLHANGDGPVTGPPRRQQHHHVGAIEHGHRGHERTGLGRQAGHDALALPGERIRQHVARRQLVRRRTQTPPLRCPDRRGRSALPAGCAGGDTRWNGGRGTRGRWRSSTPADDQPGSAGWSAPAAECCPWPRPGSRWVAPHPRDDLQRPPPPRTPLSSPPRCRPSVGDGTSPWADPMVTTRPSIAAEAGSSRPRRSADASGVPARWRWQMHSSPVQHPVVPCREPTSTPRTRLGCCSPSAPSGLLVARPRTCAAPRRRSGPGARSRKLPPAPPRATPHVRRAGRSVALRTTGAVRMAMASGRADTAGPLSMTAASAHA